MAERPTAVRANSTEPVLEALERLDLDSWSWFLRAHAVAFFPLREIWTMLRLLEAERARRAAR